MNAVTQAHRALIEADKSIEQAKQARAEAADALDRALAERGFRRAAAASANPLFESPFAPGYLLDLDSAIRAASL